MAQPQIESPLPDEDQALAWTVRRWNGVTCLAQDADTFGQRAYLRVRARAALRRGAVHQQPGRGPPGPRLLARGGRRAGRGDRAAHRRDGRPVPIEDPAPFVGTYERLHQTSRSARPSSAGLEMEISPSGVLDAAGPRRRPGRAGADGRQAGIFRATLPESGLDEVVVFTPLGDEGFSDLNPAGRLHLRVASTAASATAGAGLGAGEDLADVVDGCRR